MVIYVATIFFELLFRVIALWFTKIRKILNLFGVADSIFNGSHKPYRHLHYGILLKGNEKQKFNKLTK